MSDKSENAIKAPKKKSKRAKHLEEMQKEDIIRAKEAEQLLIMEGTPQSV